ncbi:hypothetical protein Hanom_Chr03g00180671 [Helianthus anomalus]
MQKSKREQINSTCSIAKSPIGKAGAVLPNEYAVNKPHVMFLIAELSKHERVAYVKTKKWHKMKFGDGSKLTVL